MSWTNLTELTEWRKNVQCLKSKRDYNMQGMTKNQQENTGPST